MALGVEAREDSADANLDPTDLERVRARDGRLVARAGPTEGVEARQESEGGVSGGASRDGTESQVCLSLALERRDGRLGVRGGYKEEEDPGEANGNLEET